MSLAARGREKQRRSQAVEDTRGYVLLTRAGGQPTWVCAPDYRARA